MRSSSSDAQQQGGRIPVAQAYAIVPAVEEHSDEQQQRLPPAPHASSATATALVVPTATVVVDDNVVGGRPPSTVASTAEDATGFAQGRVRRQVHPGFACLPEARGLVWRDDFFDDEMMVDSPTTNSLVAVFDLDYGAMERHHGTIGWLVLGATAFCMPNLMPCLCLSLIPCFLNQNVQWNVRAQHVAITTDGVVFVHDDAGEIGLVQQVLVNHPLELREVSLFLEIAGLLCRAKPGDMQNEAWEGDDVLGLQLNAFAALDVIVIDHDTVEAL